MGQCQTLLCLVLVWSPAAFSKDISLNNDKKPSLKVTVDVVVTDGTGQPVTGLQERDFQIFENKKRQAIRLFQARTEQHSPELPHKASLPENTFTNLDSFKPESINIILLDQVNTSLENQEVARRAIVTYFNQKPSNAAFAIFTLRNDDPACVPYNYAQRSFGVPQAQIGGFDWSCSARGRLLLVQGVTQDKTRLLEALDSRLARPHASWLRSNLTSSPFFAGPRPFNSYRFSPRDSYPVGLPEVVDTSMSSLAEMGQFLQRLPGRKGLIWMSDSFDAAPITQLAEVWFPPKFKGWEKTDPNSPTQMTHLTADRLTEARVSLYPASLAGKYKDIEIRRGCPIYYDDIASALLAPPAPTRVTAESEEGACAEHYLKLNYVASQSGGRAFYGGSQLEAVMRQAEVDNSSYYTLMYSSTRPKFDGKIRRIRIALAQKGYRVSYRRAYYADDPAAIYQSEGDTSQNIYLPQTTGPVPWQVVRVSGLNSVTSSDTGPTLAALRYGTPESNDLIFTVHIEPSGGFEPATPAQMEEIQDNASFVTERAEEALAGLKNDKRWQRKGKASVADLPPANAVSLQPYSIDYSLAPRQLTLVASGADESRFRCELALVGYDALGKEVTSFKRIVDAKVAGSERGRFQGSDFHLKQRVEIPDRVTLFRFAIRDLSSNRIGSLEVPLWAISSPYRRKELPLNLSKQDSNGNPVE